jgi:hypothetical protein
MLQKVLQKNADAKNQFKYFQNFRDKHIIHDENPVSQSFCGVAINGEGAGCKVADIIAGALNAFTVSGENLTNFTRLVNLSLEWVIKKIDGLQKIMGHAYENWSYEKLLALPDVQITAHGFGSDVVGVKR